MNTIQTPIELSRLRWNKILLAIILAYFFIQACFFATSIKPGIAPDDIEHAQIAILYSKTNDFILHDSHETYRFGPISTKPYLYYQLLAKLSVLKVFNIPSILYFRFINIVLGMFTALYAYKLAREVTNNKLVSLLSLIVLTNTMMFAFLVSHVNYDNLVNLLAVVSLYYLFRYCKTGLIAEMMKSLIFALLGMLAKVSFAPLLAIIILVYGIETTRRYRKKIQLIIVPAGIKTSTLIGSCIAILCLLLLNYHLYIGNIQKYGHPVPGCRRVLTEQQCSEKQNIRIYKNLQRLASKEKKGDLLPLHQYFFKWSDRIEAGILGIFGHVVLFKNPKDLWPYNLLLLLSFLVFLLRLKSLKNRLLVYSFLIFLLYTFVIFYRVNYATYRSTAYLYAGLHGRYLFPVLVPAIILFSTYLLALGRKSIKIGIFCIVAFVFIQGNLPYFINHVHKTWYVDYKNEKRWDIDYYEARLNASQKAFADRLAQSP